MLLQNAVKQKKEKGRRGGVGGHYINHLITLPPPTPLSGWVGWGGGTNVANTLFIPLARTPSCALDVWRVS